jgi:nucleoside-diphosphate-sugar epimerase
MKVFVAGATGVVGRRAVPRLVAAGHEVTGVARTAEKSAGVEQGGGRAVALDLFEVEAVRRAVAGHDAVINLATSIPRGARAFLPGAWRENDRIRSVASAYLVDAAVAGGATRFVQESFAPVYPDRGDEWIDETTPLKVARYNRTVADAERAAAGFNAGGRSAVILRFGFFYGPDSGYTLDLIRFVRKGFVPLPAPARGFVSSVSHDDAASAVVAALGAGAGVYNVIDDEPMRRREFFDALAEALGVRPPRLAPAWLSVLAGSVGETLSRSQRISNRKLRTHVGWAPQYPSVREGWRAVLASLNPAP